MYTHTAAANILAHSNELSLCVPCVLWPQCTYVLLIAIAIAWRDYLQINYALHICVLCVCCAVLFGKSEILLQ